jgi:Protein of unknown function (DUF3293)
MSDSAALADLLELDGRLASAREGVPAARLLDEVCASPWLRFAVGVNDGEPAPAGDVAGAARAAREFAATWALWRAYRECHIELHPPGGAAVEFWIDPALGGAPPVEFPAATFAVLTAWNPGSGEPRPNERANRRANEQLARHLDARLLARWPATNAPGSRWREESFAVLGIDLDEALRIGEAFQQRAIYYVDRGIPLLVARRRDRMTMWRGSLRVAR